MDMEPSSHIQLSPEPLTEKNLLRLQRHIQSPSPTPSISSQPTRPTRPIPSPSERLQYAKRWVTSIVRNLYDLGHSKRYEEHHRRKIREILHNDELRLTRYGDIRYRRNEGKTHDLEDPIYWETKNEYFESIYQFYLELRDAKDRVYETMRALERLGHEGRQALEEEELYIAGQNDVRYRGKREPEPDLDDPAYWKVRLRDLRVKYAAIKRETPPPSPLVKPEQAKDWLYNIIRALQNLGQESWVLRTKLYIAGENDVRYRGDGGSEPDLEDPAVWMAYVQYLGKSYALHSSWRELALTQPVATLEQAKEWVFNAMWALALDSEGRRILDDDELYIASWNNVQYRGRDRNLEEPAYWMGRLRYFHDKYQDVSQWGISLSSAKGRVYEEMERLWQHGRDGWRFLLHDELYMDMATGVVYYRGDDGYDPRYEGRERPDLEDPGYWDRKTQKFKAKYEQAKGGSLSPYSFTYTEQEELDLMQEQAKNAFELATCQDDRNQTKKGIEMWADALQRDDLRQPSSPASIPSSAPESISSHGDRNIQRLSEEPHSGGLVGGCLEQTRRYYKSFPARGLERVEVYFILKELEELGSEGREALAADELYLTDEKVCYRENWRGEDGRERGMYILGEDIGYRPTVGRKPNLDCAAYWEKKKQDLERERDKIKIERIQKQIYDTVMALQGYGREGQESLNAEGLYIAGPENVVCCRDRDIPKQSLQRPWYWERKLEDLNNRYRRLSKGESPTPSPERTPSPPIIPISKAREGHHLYSSETTHLTASRRALKRGICDLGVTAGGTADQAEVETTHPAKRIRQQRWTTEMLTTTKPPTMEAAELHFAAPDAPVRQMRRSARKRNIEVASGIQDGMSAQPPTHKPAGTAKKPRRGKHVSDHNAQQQGVHQPAKRQAPSGSWYQLKPRRSARIAALKGGTPGNT